MEDDVAVYILLGIGEQTHIYYTIPVKDMLYDSFNYVAQVDEARYLYRKEIEAELSFGSVHGGCPTRWLKIYNPFYLRGRDDVE